MYVHSYIRLCSTHVDVSTYICTYKYVSACIHTYMNMYVRGSVGGCGCGFTFVNVCMWYCPGHSLVAHHRQVQRC